MALINVKVATITQEAEGVRSYLLVKRGPFKLPQYKPGAHIDVHCGEGIIRQYSLCGDPTDRRHFLIAVREVDPSRGGSDLMHNSVKEGDRLEIGSPRNHFSLDEASSHSLLLAGGIGITPIIAMADRLHGLNRSFELHYFNRSSDHTAFRKRLVHGAFARCVKLHEGLDVSQTLEQLRNILSRPKAGAQVYLCGPGPFMDAAIALAEKHWPTDSIRFERFASNPSLASSPTSPFQIELKRSGIVLDVGVNETILDVLEAHDIDVPFSCEQGVCGTCVTQVLDGEPEHRDSFLSLRQKANNRQMCLCVSRAQSEKIVLPL